MLPLSSYNKLWKLRSWVREWQQYAVSGCIRIVYVTGSAGNGSKDWNLEGLEFDNKAIDEDFDEDTGVDDQATTYVNDSAANGRTQESKSPTETRKSLSLLEKKLQKKMLSRTTSNFSDKNSNSE